MDREKRKSGLSLAFAGLLGVLFFWLTDPVWGVSRVGQSSAEPRWVAEASAATDRPVVNPIDSRNEAIVGTTIGVIGSAVVGLFGLVIATRRPT